MNQEQSMSDTKAAKSRTIQLCVRFDEHDVELLKTLCREEKQGRHDAIQSLAFRLEASLLSESDDRTGHADDEVSALQELQAENERLTGVCKEFDTLVSRLSRSLSATEKANAKLREAAQSVLWSRTARMVKDAHAVYEDISYDEYAIERLRAAVVDCRAAPAQAGPTPAVFRRGEGVVSAYVCGVQQWEEVAK